MAVTRLSLGCCVVLARSAVNPSFRILAVGDPEELAILNSKRIYALGHRRSFRS